MWKLSNWPTCYMTIGEAAAILGRHEQTLYRAARAGRFPVVRTFGSLRIDPATLTACSRSAAQKPPLELLAR